MGRRGGGNPYSFLLGEVEGVGEPHVEALRTRALIAGALSGVLHDNFIEGTHHLGLLGGFHDCCGLASSDVQYNHAISIGANIFFVFFDWID